MHVFLPSTACVSPCLSSPQLTTEGAPAALAHKGLANAVYLDFHFSKGLLFWMDTAQNVIYHSLITGNSPPTGTCQRPARDGRGRGLGTGDHRVGAGDCWTG